MAKRLIALVAVFVLAFAIAGCSSGGSSAASSSAASASGSASAESSSSASSSSSLFASAGWPQNEVTEGVPVPQFSVDTDKVSTNEMGAAVEYKNVPEDEVAAYVEEVKAAGFTYNVSENKASDNYRYNASNGEDRGKSIDITLSYTPEGDFAVMILNYGVALR